MRTSAATTRLVCSTSASWHNSRDRTFSWRGGRAVECAGLENRKAERPREFESHPLRASSVVLPVNFPDNDFMGEQNEDYEPRFDWRARSRRITSEALTLRPAKHLRRPEVRATVG